MTRWHGTMIPTGLRPFAPPTARDAPAATPIRRARSPYVQDVPNGISCNAAHTHCWNSVPLSRSGTENTLRSPAKYSAICSIAVMIARDFGGPVSMRPAGKCFWPTKNNPVRQSSSARYARWPSGLGAMWHSIKIRLRPIFFNAQMNGLSVLPAGFGGSSASFTGRFASFCKASTMAFTAFCSASAVVKPVLSRAISRSPEMEIRAVSLAITSASPLMLSVSVSLANGLNTFQSSNALIFQRVRNAWKLQPAHGFKFMDRLDRVFVRRRVVDHHGERQVTPGQIHYLIQLRGHEHARLANSLQLPSGKQGTRDHVGIAGLLHQPPHGLFYTRPDAPVVRRILRHDVRERKRFRHAFLVPAIAGRAHVTAIVAALLVVRERGAVAGRQFFIDEKTVGAGVVAGIVHVFRRQVFRRPQRPVRHAGMQDGEVGITELLRRDAHLRIGDNGRAATGAELGTVAGREGIEGHGSAERGQ